MNRIKQLPELLQPSVEQQWQSFIESDIDVSLLPDEIAEILPKVWACSEFVMHACVRFPEMFMELATSGDLQKSYPDGHYKQSIIVELKHADEDALSKQLRLFRRREMLRIVWRDIAGWSELMETTGDLSYMAEACIDYALSNLYQWQCHDLGIPVNDEGIPQHLVVLGMGKLGAWELNVSSDIDLIFAFPEDGEVKDGPKELTNSEFFTRLGKKLIQSLDQQTADGFVFRVDMRLRPFGAGGPLVSSFNSFENYYLVHGRSWERYAMVKVRVVAGDYEQGDELLAMIKPFVYRRYLDFGAYESLRELKAMITQEVKRKGMKNNVKLGGGGIREVEFVAQVFQLIRGGRDSDLQERRVLMVLDHLMEKNLLPDYVIKELKEAYVFLRNTEHRIQEYQDRQSHNLPDDELGQARLALGMGFEDWSSFLEKLNQHRENVEAHFEQVFVAPQTEETQAAGDSEQQSEIMQLEAIWYNKLDEELALDLLSQKGFSDSAAALKKLKTLHKSRQYASLSRQGQTRFDRLMPLLLGALKQVENVDTTFDRILSLLTNVARRSVYLALLLENPMVLSQLIKLCSASPWIARYLQQLPILLDELMDARSLYQPPEKPELEKDIRQRLMQIESDDVEQGMDALRHFKQSNVLRVAAADIADALPLMKVSDHLSWIAEVILDEALEQAWRHLVSRHGRPVCKLEEGKGSLCDKGFAVIGYGKLGGYELGYGSDLDMVFLHGSESNNLMTLVEEHHGDEAKAKKPIAVPVFFARLGQRIIHLLTSHTSAGVLYEADMRLRPDGASGMLVSNLKSYRDYQMNKAWLWEHQALVRARVVAGDPQIAEEFTEIRKEVLSQQRDQTVLRQEVLDMRNRMRKELSKEKNGQFDLKQGAGGIVDIEFMVQYGVLAWAFEKPDLLEYTDNIRLLKALGSAGLMAKVDVEVLSDAYRTFRARLHKMALQEQPGLVDAEEYSELSESVRQIWLNWLENE